MISGNRIWILLQVVIGFLFFFTSSSFIYWKSQTFQIYDIYVGCFSIILMIFVRRFWGVPVAMFLIFYGLNPSVYRITPFESYTLCGAFLVSIEYIVMFLKSCSISFDSISKSSFALLCMIFIYMGLSIWPLFQSLFSYCHVNNMCLDSVFFAHSSSFFWGLRSFFTFSVSFSLMFIFMTNNSMLPSFFVSFVISCLFFGFVSTLQIFKFDLELVFYRDFYNLFLTPYKDKSRVIGLFANPGWAGQFYLFAIPAFMYIYSKIYRNIISLLILILFIIQALYTQQRATWLSLGIVLVFFLLRETRGRIEKKWVLAGFFSSTLIFILFSYHLGLMSRAMSMKSDARMSMIYYAPDMLRNIDLLWGAGLGGFSKIYRQTLTQKGLRFPIWETAHNTYLNLLIEMGPLFLVMFLMFCLCVGIFSYRKRHQCEVFFISLSLLGIFVNSFFQYIFYVRSISFMFFISIGILLSFGVSQHNNDKNNHNYLLTFVIFFFVPIFIFAKPTRMTGCYLEEPVANAEYNKWCGPLSTWRISVSKDHISSFVIRPFAAHKIRVSLKGSDDDRFYEYKEFTKRYAKELISFDVSHERFSNQDFFDVKFEADDTSLQMDRRSLSFGLNAPEKKSLSRIENIRGLYYPERQGKKYWRWSPKESRFTVIPFPYCKNKVRFSFPKFQTKEKFSLELSKNGEEKISISLRPGTYHDVVIDENAPTSFTAKSNFYFIPREMGISTDARELSFQVSEPFCI